MGEELFRPRRPLIRQTEMPLPEAMGKFGEAGAAPRGTLVSGFPRLPAVSVERLRVTFQPNGEVSVPRYGETFDGKLRIVGYESVRDASAAIRQAWHQEEGAAAEERRLDGLFTQIQGLHEAVARGWGGFNPAQKKSAVDYTEGLIDGLTPARGALSERHKTKAVERLEDASGLLRDGNVNAALAAMVGAANDVVARKTSLLRQSRLLERRRKSIAHAKFDADREFYEQLDRVISVDGALSGPKPPPRTDLEALATSLEGVARSLGARQDKRARKCAALSRKAAKDLRRGYVGRAIPAERLARKTMVDLISESTVLHQDRLKWVEGHRDTELKRHVVGNQLRYFAEMAEYWLSKARPEQVEGMNAYLINLSNALSGAKQPRTQTRIADAARKFSEKDVAGCKEMLAEALKELQ
jgi:hypothetical protein